MKIIITETQYRKLLKENLNIIKSVGTNIMPEDWEYIGGAVVVSAEISGDDEATLMLIDDGYPQDVSNVLQTNLKEKCAVCGKQIGNRTLFKNKSNDEYIFVGFDCSKNILKFSLDSKDAKKQGLRKRITADRLNRIQNILTTNPDLDLWLTANHKIARNLRDYLNSKGNLSDAQIKLAEKIYNDRTNFEKTSKNVELENDKTFTGDMEIISFSHKPTKQGFGRSETEEGGVYITLRHPDGWKMYGLVAIAPQIYYRNLKINDKESKQKLDAANKRLGELWEYYGESDYEKLKEKIKEKTIEILKKYNNKELEINLINDTISDLDNALMVRSEYQKNRYEKARQVPIEYTNRLYHANNFQISNTKALINYIHEDLEKEIHLIVSRDNKENGYLEYPSLAVSDLAVKILNDKLKGKIVNITAKNIKISDKDKYMSFSNSILIKI